MRRSVRKSGGARVVHELLVLTKAREILQQIPRGEGALGRARQTQAARVKAYPDQKLRPATDREGTGPSVPSVPPPYRSAAKIRLFGISGLMPEVSRKVKRSIVLFVLLCCLACPLRDKYVHA